MLILVLTISASTSLVCVPVGITSSAVWIKICAITAGIIKYKSIRGRSMINSIVKKYKLNTIEFLNSKALIDS